MRTETKTYNIYTFDELKPEIQQKVLDDTRAINTEYDWWDYTINCIIEDLAEKGIDINANDVSFNFYRGSYFSIGKADIDNEKFLQYALKEKAINQTEYEFIIDKLENDFIWFDINAYRECPTELDINIDEDEESTNEYGKLFGTYEQFNAHRQISIQETLNDLLLKIQSDCLDTLYKEYEYLESDEGVKDTIEANEYEFLEDGERV